MTSVVDRYAGIDMLTRRSKVMELALPVVLADDSPEEWASRVTSAFTTSVSSIIEVGRVLRAAKRDLGHRRFLSIFKGRPGAVQTPVPFGERTAQLYMKIAGHAILSNPKCISHLPPSLGTLAELARLEPVTVESYINLGRIHPEMTRVEAIALVIRLEQPTSSPSAIQTRAAEFDTLELDQQAIRNYWREVEMSGPLLLNGHNIESSDWVTEIRVRTASDSSKSSHRCICAECGHSHVARKQ